MTFEETTWSYGDLIARIDSLAGIFQRDGIRPGDRVGFLGFNHPMCLAALFAASKLGAIFVPLNFRLTASELEFIINDAEIHTLIVDADHQPVLDPVRADLVCKRYYGFDAANANWPDIIGQAASATPVRQAFECSQDDIAIVMYTSGTTGRPKGSMLTCANVWSNMVNELIEVDFSSDDVVLTFAPQFHVSGLNILTLTTLLKGAHLVLHKAFDPERIIADIGRHGVTWTFAVPAMLQFISQHPSFKGDAMPSLKSIFVGGAPCPEVLLKQFNSRGISVNQAYGLTETAAMASHLAHEYALAKTGSIGKPPLLGRMRLISSDGSVITTPHTKGEICVRGMNVTPGYLNRPEATREAIDAEGWFRTGDGGYFDEEGFYYICDRIKDMVISGGENVYPAEVESVLFEHPAIAEAAVIGRPDEKWGETVVAVVTLKKGATLSIDELQAFAGTKLARYKVPRELHIVDSLPRNPTGKILKKVLREKFSH